MKLPNAINCLLELLFPHICVVCGQRLIQSEEHICLKCLLQMPRTNFHLQDDNPMEQLFIGRIPVRKASAYFEFKKGSNYQKILHQLKYKGQKEIGRFLGERFAAELKAINHFQDADFICPVPLHPRKERKRGYNQSYSIASGLSEQLNVPIINNLKRIAYTSTQTKKTRFERWQNMEGIFDISDPEELNGKHIILVDDVVTTGATLEACANAILKKCDAEISLLTLAIA